MNIRQAIAKFTQRGQRGFGIVETLVAVAILGTSVTAFIAGLSAGTVATGAQDTLLTSQGLAQSQVEYTKSRAYNASAVTYPAITVPPGYNISAAVSAVPDADANIQKITVTVSHNGEAIVTVADYKVNR